MSRSSCLLVLFLMLSGAPRAVALDTMPVEQLKPGMTGHGLSVFSGTTVERFRVTIVGVLDNVFPGQDMILARCARWDEKSFDVGKTGIQQGMSGSPIYIDGKLIGALAYGWSFNRDGLFGITPIANMIADQKRPAGAKKVVYKGGAKGALAELRRLAGGRPAGGALTPCRAPLIVSGATPGTLRQLEQQFKGTWLRPLAGGGSSDDGDAAARRKLMVPGGAVAVSLMTGDMDFTAVGTITYVEGDQVSAFGHPFFGQGDSALPMQAARIAGIVNSALTSFKMGSGVGMVGAMTNDRQASIVGKLGDAPSMIPIRFTIHNTLIGAERSKRVFNCKLARHPVFGPLLLGMALSNFVEVSEPVTGDFSARYTTRVWLEGREQPVVYSDVSAGRGGLSSGPLSGPVSMLMTSPFAAPRITKVEIEASLEVADKVATLERATLLTREPKAGETIRVQALLRSKASGDRRVEIALQLPDDLPPGRHVLFLEGGDGYAPELPAPRTLEQLIARLDAFEKGDALVLRLPLPRLTLQHRGQPLRELPKSVVGALLPTRSTGEVGAKQDAVRASKKLPVVIRGRLRLPIEVK